MSGGGACQSTYSCPEYNYWEDALYGKVFYANSFIADYLHGCSGRPSGDISLLLVVCCLDNSTTVKTTTTKNKQKI